MSNGRRVVVVGGGIVGASAAFHLADGGAEVVLVDDHREGRATHAGAGIVGWPWRDPGRPIFELVRRAVAAYTELSARVGACLDVVGEIFVAPPGRLLDESEEALAGGTVGPVRRLEPEQARAAFPYLAPQLAALYVTTTARVQGDAIRDRLLDAAMASGAEVVAGRAELVCGPRGVQAVVIAGRRTVAGDVVVAAGAWSAELVAPAGVTVAVAPQRGQILHLGVREDTTAMTIVQPLDADHYLLPFRLADATLRELRVGLRPSTPDGNPILGAIAGYAGLWAATGTGPQGLTIGPYCGRLIANAILGRPEEIDLAPYAPTRFS